jgi:hypothetical protein
MSWVVFDDVAGERMAVDLQPTAVEVFRSRSTETVRMHLGLLRIGVQGPDAQGVYGVDLVAPDGRVVTTIRVGEPWWSRLWPWIEQVRQAQIPFTHVGY